MSHTNGRRSAHVQNRILASPAMMSAECRQAAALSGNHAEAGGFWEHSCWKHLGSEVPREDLRDISCIDQNLDEGVTRQISGLQRFAETSYN